MATIPSLGWDELLKQRAKNTGSYDLANTFWDWLVFEHKEFRRQISTKGYFLLEKVAISNAYQEWSFSLQQGRLRNRHSDRRSFQQKFPLIFTTGSIDYYSQTPEPLQVLGLYAIRTGRGNCLVFNSKVFPLPYGGPVLCSRNCKQEIPTRIPTGYRSLTHLLSLHMNEQSFLRMLHFTGIFKELVKHICGTDKYEFGPSGHTASSFPFWMRYRHRGTLARFVFQGITDLDDCLFARNMDAVIPIEAKIDDGAHYDIGWHKLAFPCYKFINSSLSSRWGKDYGFEKRGTKIFPVLCVFTPWEKMAYLYIFPKIKIHRQKFGAGMGNTDVEYGIVLNDINQFTPREVLGVSMRNCWN